VQGTSVLFAIVHFIKMTASMGQSSPFLENSLLTNDEKNIKYFFISLKEGNIVVNTN